MVRTKGLLFKLEQARRARELIDSGATAEDIAKAFKCTTIGGVLSHVRDAFRLGGSVLANARQFPAVRSSRTAFASEERPRNLSGRDSITSGLDTLRLGLQAGSLAFQNQLEDFAGIHPSDDAATRVSKIFNKFYGVPESFNPDQALGIKARRKSSKTTKA